MVNTDYSDETLDVVYQYDNFGRVKQVDQGNVNRHVYAYNPANLLLDTETITYGLNTANPFVRVMDHSDGDTLLREKTCVLRNGANAEHTVGKTYDTAGRLKTITHGGDQVHTYNYVINTHALPAGITSPAHSVINPYESTRNVLLAKSNQVASNEVSRYDYTVNDLGHRIDIGRSGTAFSAAATETAGYNARGEVVQTTIPGQLNRNRSYNFDGIGNRTTATVGTVETSYVPNILNEYATVAGTTQTHDDDGNLIDNGTFTFNWDAENRLLSVTDRVSNNVVIDYKYDYYSRRIERNNNHGKTTWIYHGWNPCGQYLEGTLDRTYTWGTDLSGSEQGVGGVGGLLAVTDANSGSHYYPTFDGNGNISEYIDDQQETVPHYEYDAFGNTIASSGAKADFFEHRFSTKPFDEELGFYYYGHRYYEPATGMWSSRDPIAERGGVNLYGFVGNKPLGKIDVFGFQGWENVYYDHIPEVESGLTWSDVGNFLSDVWDFITTPPSYPTPPPLMAPTQWQAKEKYVWGPACICCEGIPHESTQEVTINVQLHFGVLANLFSEQIEANLGVSIGASYGVGVNLQCTGEGTKDNPICYQGGLLFTWAERRVNYYSSGSAGVGAPGMVLSQWRTEIQNLRWTSKVRPIACPCGDPLEGLENH